MSARDGGNILDKPYADAVQRLDDYIQDISVDHNGKTYTYKDLCLKWQGEHCPGNKHVHLISNLFQRGVNITYPMAKFGKM